MQVGEVEAMFVALKADVEALFMTAPSVSLAELAQEVVDAHSHLDSQARLSCCWHLPMAMAPLLFTQPTLSKGVGSAGARPLAAEHSARNVSAQHLSFLQLGARKGPLQAGKFAGRDWLQADSACRAQKTSTCSLSERNATSCALVEVSLQ